MKSPQRMVAHLDRARRRPILVRVTREIPGADRLEGYAVGTGRRWVLIATRDAHLRPDGYSAIRVRDIDAVWRHTAGERLARRSLQLQGAWPLSAPPVDVDLDTTAALVEILVRGFGIVSVFIEDDDPDVCFIGRLASSRGARVTLDEISPQGRWEGTFRARRRRVSRIDVGDGYHAALLTVAGPHPA